MVNLDPKKMHGDQLGTRKKVCWAAGPADQVKLEQGEQGHFRDYIQSYWEAIYNNKTDFFFKPELRSNYYNKLMLI